MLRSCLKKALRTAASAACKKVRFCTTAVENEDTAAGRKGARCTAPGGITQSPERSREAKNTAKVVKNLAELENEEQNNELKWKTQKQGESCGERTTWSSVLGQNEACRQTLNPAASRMCILLKHAPPWVS